MTLLLSDFDFHLPDERIASHPAKPRDAARLLHVNKGALRDHFVHELPSLLQEGDVLVLNDTKVVPARLFGRRGEVKVEILLNKPDPRDPRLWSVLARPGKRLKAGQTILFAPAFEADIVDKRADGEILVRFSHDRDELFSLLRKHGHIPLPPYIKRPDTLKDGADYQTVYAAKDGAVAAPTAGFHFTPELFARLEERNIARCAVTLHVGAGTFLPVKSEKISEHKMHAEWGEIAPQTAALINDAKKRGRRIVPVGTTALRLLESAAGQDGSVRPFSGETDIFITPGYRFAVANALITNFHLPKSTLFMLVSAFAGLDNMRAAYAHAIENKYRFYSYGDATLIEKNA